MLCFFLLFGGLQISSFPYFVQLFLFCVENLLSGDSPPIMQSPIFAQILHQLCKVLPRFSTNYAMSYFCKVLLSPLMARNLVEVLFVVLVCIRLLGNVVRVYPKIVQGLTFLPT